MILLTIGCSKPEEYSEEAEHSHNAEKKLGGEKAVTKADEQKGIKLASHSINLLKIKTVLLQKFATNQYVYQIPKSSLVYFEDKVGIYYKRGEWYNLKGVKIHSNTGSTVAISTKYLLNIDQLVVSGVPLLRLAHLEAFGASGEGHGH